MYELSENPAENSKRHLRALPGIPDMCVWGGAWESSSCITPAQPPSGPPSHLPCRKKLWAATYSPFALSQGASLHTSLQGSVPRKEAPAYAITQPPWAGLSQQEGKKSKGKRRGGGRTTLGVVMSIHDCRSCQTATLPRLRLFPALVTPCLPLFHQP